MSMTSMARMTYMSPTARERGVEGESQPHRRVHLNENEEGDALRANSAVKILSTTRA